MLIIKRQKVVSWKKNCYRKVFAKQYKSVEHHVQLLHLESRSEIKSVYLGHLKITNGESGHFNAVSANRYILMKYRIQLMNIHQIFTLKRPWDGSSPGISTIINFSVWLLIKLIIYFFNWIDKYDGKRSFLKQSTKYFSTVSTYSFISSSRLCNETITRRYSSFIKITK